MIPRLLTFAALLGISASVFLPFARAHFAWRDLADAYIHLVRIFMVDAALARGDTYPRWLPDLYLGYGYPLLNFYAPATYYLGSLFHRLGATIYGSLQLLGALSVVLGATGTYALARSLSPGSRAAAFLAAGAYALAPYPFLTNLYVRAALPETLGLGLVPWLFLAVHRAATRPDRSSCCALALAVASLILTHNVTALTTIPFAVLYGGSVILKCTPNRLLAVRSTVLGLVAGLALSAFFWLPALAEARFVQLDLLGGGIYDFRTWLLNPLAGLADLTPAYDYSALDRAVPAKLSLIQLAFLFATLVASLATRRVVATAPWLLTSALCIFLNTTWSDSLWSHLPLLALTQFPWRFYGLGSLAIAIAGALSLGSIVPRRLPPSLTAAVSCVIIVAFAVSSLARRPLLFAPDPPHDVDERIVAAEEYNKYGAGTTSGGEFLPRTAQWDEGPRDRRRGIRVYDELYPQTSWQAGLVRVLTGRASVSGVRQSANAVAAEVDAAEPSVLIVHQLLFPGWRAFLDGALVPLSLVPNDPSRAVSLGFMAVAVPAGKHRVELRFGPTPVRTAGACLSGAALATLAWLVIRRRASSRGVRGPTGLVPIGAAGLLGASLAAAFVELPARLPCCAGDASWRITTDVSSELVEARAQTTSPLGRAAGPMVPYVDLRFLSLGGDTRRWLFVHPPSEISLPVRVPSRAFLQTALAIDPVAWDQPLGDGARFIAELEIGGTRHIVLDRTLHPRGRSEDRGWVDVWADLSVHSGREGRLILRTESRDEPSFDWAGFAHPQVVVWRAARPVPSAPHPW